MAEKFVDKIEDLLAQVVKADGKKELDNLLSFTLPDVTAKTESISGYSGMVGEISFPNWSELETMELSLKFSNYPDSLKEYLTTGSVTVKLNWAESYVNKSGALAYDSYAATLSVFPANLPGGDKKKGERSENEFKSQVKAYKLIKNGTEICDIDLLTGKVKIFGTDMATNMKSALIKY